MQIQDSFIVSIIGNSCSFFFINVNDFSVALCIEIASGVIKLLKRSMIVGFDFVDHIHSFCSGCSVVIIQHNEKDIFWVTD